MSPFPLEPREVPKCRRWDRFLFYCNLLVLLFKLFLTTVISPPSHSKFQELATLNLACLRDHSNPELSQLLAECILVGFLSQDNNNPNLISKRHQNKLKGIWR